MRFFMPIKARWAAIAEKTTVVGEYLTDAFRDSMKRNESAGIAGIFDGPDFNATAAGQRIVDDGRLKLLATIRP